MMVLSIMTFAYQEIKWKLRCSDLKQITKWYRPIQISEQRLSQLPEDDNLEDNSMTQHEDPPLPLDSAIEDDVELVNDLTDAMGMIF